MFVKFFPVVSRHLYTVSWETDQSTCPSTYIPTFLPTYLSLHCIYLFHFLSSLSVFSLAWHRGTGSVTSSQHSFISLGGCSRMSVNLIWNPQPGFGSFLQTLLALKWSLWSPSYSVVYLRDGLPVITQQSASAVCGTVPVLSLPLLWLGFTVEAKVLCNKLLSHSTELPQRCIWHSGNVIKNTWMGNLSYTVQRAKNVYSAEELSCMTVTG